MFKTKPFERNQGGPTLHLNIFCKEPCIREIIIAQDFLYPHVAFYREGSNVNNSNTLMALC